MCGNQTTGGGWSGYNYQAQAHLNSCLMLSHSQSLSAFWCEITLPGARTDSPWCRELVNNNLYNDDRKLPREMMNVHETRDPIKLVASKICTKLSFEHDN